jgi:hypothetical protein
VPRRPHRRWHSSNNHLFPNDRVVGVPECALDRGGAVPGVEPGHDADERGLPRPQRVVPSGRSRAALRSIKTVSLAPPIRRSRPPSVTAGPLMLFRGTAPPDALFILHQALPSRFDLTLGVGDRAQKLMIHSGLLKPTSSTRSPGATPPATIAEALASAARRRSATKLGPEAADDPLADPVPRPTQCAEQQKHKIRRLRRYHSELLRKVSDSSWSIPAPDPLHAGPLQSRSDKGADSPAAAAP